MIGPINSVNIPYSPSVPVSVKSPSTGSEPQVTQQSTAPASFSDLRPIKEARTQSPPLVSDPVRSEGVTQVQKDLASTVTGPVHVNIIHTNDEHDGNFSSLAKEATVVHRLKKEHGDGSSIVVNTGDLTFTQTHDQPGKDYFGPAARALNAEGVDYVTPGNHEFQHGGKALDNDLLSKLNAKTLLGNVTELSTGKPLEHTKPYEIREINGVKVGVIGLTTPRQKTKDHPDVGSDVKVDQLDTTANALVKQAKAEGADITVLLAHEGINKLKGLASRVPGLDVVVAGHDHQVTENPETVQNPDGRTTYIVEAGGVDEFNGMVKDKRYVGDLNLEIDPQTRRITGVNHQLIPTAGEIPDPEVAAIISAYNKDSK